MKRIFTLFLAIVFVVSMFAFAASAEETQHEKIVINVTSTQGSNQLLGNGAEIFAERVMEAMDWVEVNTYVGASLYTSEEEVDALSKNDIQVIFCPGTNLASVDPAMGVFKLPFLFPNLEVAYQVLDDQEISDLIFQNIENFKVIGALTMGSCYIANSKHEIALPSDMEGLTLRTPGKIESDIISACGASPVTIDNSETFTALQQNTVDGLATPSLVYMQRQYYEVTKYCTDCGMLFWPVSFIITNETFWNDLDEETRNGLIEIFDALVPERREMAKTSMEDTKQSVIDNNVTFYEVQEEDIETWKEATASVFDKQRDSIGGDIIDAVKAKVEEVTGK